MFSEFDNYLSLDFLIDYWYDEGTSIASSLLSKFDEQAWAELRKVCTSRPIKWQVRCAEVLDLVSHPASVDILMKYLSSENDDVTVAAADSLRSKSDVHLSACLIEKLRRLLAEGSAPVKLVLAGLLERFA